MGARPPPVPTLHPEMPLSGHLLTFMLTCVTDLALIPPLIVMRRYRRHFEIYVGCVMFVSAFAYNFLDAMNRGDAAEKSWELFIKEEDWHRISNVSSTTYICLLLIHLMCMPSPDANIVLRYGAASLVLLAQVKDGFWMQETYYTVYVVGMFVLLLVARYVSVAEMPVYWTSDNLLRGAGLGAAAGVCFYFGLDDDHDEFRFAHGLSHLFGGLALTFLWNLVPRPKKKEEDPFSRASLYR
mmetsp:Transcript_35027/g.70753  ORF Transcript_35027/g.70753 Transcript_35027/m.70753 type:complete len:240 (+) Transcript_35027:3-722(+)